MDKIQIKELEVFANHGVFPEENALGQKFVVSTTLYTDTRRAGMTDDLTASIHYGEVSQMIKAFLQENTYQLIERACEQLARELLLKVPNLEKIDLEIEKPWAPVRLPLKTVSVSITRGWHEAYIALGSNMGDKEAYLTEAVRLMRLMPDSEMLVVSDFITTEPYGYVDQDEFLNGALKIKTLLTPFELLDELHKIEQNANRERLIHWGPRTLDLDILLYDDELIDTKDLIIPHIEMHKRDFVLKPMAQIAPYKRHPILHKTMQELANELKES